MAKFHFFCRPNILTLQSSTSESFGPIDFNTFQSSSNHDISSIVPDDRAAYAICNGTICVLTNDFGDLTIILKPHPQPPFDFPYIKYFIYRGITVDSLVQSVTGGIKDFSTFPSQEQIPFLNRIATMWRDQSMSVFDVASQSAHCLGLGYGPGNGFPNSESVDKLFYNLNDDIALPVVKAGEKIGEFGFSQISLQIVVERSGFDLTLGQVRQSDTLIHATNVSGSNTATPDSANYFKHWHQKEQCLNFIDPCAFFGAFAGYKLHYRDGVFPARNIDDLQAEILSTFANRHRMYIDIRDDYGYSLNYFKNYGFQLTFSAPDPDFPSPPLDVDLSDLTGLNKGWPILIVEYQDVSLHGNTSIGRPGGSDVFQTWMRLPLGSNLDPNNPSNQEPLVYFVCGNSARGRRISKVNRVQWLDTEIDGTSDGFTSNIKLKMDIWRDNTLAPFLSAGYIKLCYFDKKRNQLAPTPVANHPPVLSKESYLTGLFRPGEMKTALSLRGDITNGTGDTLYVKTWSQEVLIDLSKNGGPIIVAHPGLAREAEKTTLFAVPVFFVKDRYRRQMSPSLTSWPGISKVSDKTFVEEVFERFQSRRPMKLELPGGSTSEVIVSEVNPWSAVTSKLQANESPDNMILIVLDEGASEYNAMISAIDNDTSLLQSGSSENLSYPVFLVQDGPAVEMTDSDYPYHKRTLKLAGFKKSVSGKIERHVVSNWSKEVFDYADL